MNRRIDNVVRGLIEVGVRQGEHVGVLMETRPSALVAIAALSRLGAVAVLLKPDVDLTAVRDALRASLTQPTEVTFGPAALLGYEVEPREIKPGSRLDLTLMFEALQNRPPEHALITRLRNA